MTTIMYYSLIGLAIQFAILAYLLPIKVFNHPKKLWGYLYLFKIDWWRVTCCQKEDEDEADDSRVNGARFELHDDEKNLLLGGKYEEPG